MTENEQRVAAKAFADKWQGKGYEKVETQKFWLELISTVYGVKEPVFMVSRSTKCHLTATGTATRPATSYNIYKIKINA